MLYCNVVIFSLSRWHGVSRPQHDGQIPSSNHRSACKYHYSPPQLSSLCWGLASSWLPGRCGASQADTDTVCVPLCSPFSHAPIQSHTPTSSAYPHARLTPRYLSCLLPFTVISVLTPLSHPPFFSPPFHYLIITMLALFVPRVTFGNQILTIYCGNKPS